MDAIASHSKSEHLSVWAKVGFTGDRNNALGHHLTVTETAWASVMRRKAAGYLGAVSENQSHQVRCRSAVGRVGRQSTLCLKLTPFRGHLILKEEGVRNGKNQAAVSGRIQAADC